MEQSNGIVCLSVWTLCVIRDIHTLLFHLQCHLSTFHSNFGWGYAIKTEFCFWFLLKLFSCPTWIQAYFSWIVAVRPRLLCKFFWEPSALKALTHCAIACRLVCALWMDEKAAETNQSNFMLFKISPRWWCTMQRNTSTGQTTCWWWAQMDCGMWRRTGTWQTLCLLTYPAATPLIPWGLCTVNCSSAVIWHVREAGKYSFLNWCQH